MKIGTIRNQARVKVMSRLLTIRCGSCKQWLAGELGAEGTASAFLRSRGWRERDREWTCTNCTMMAKASFYNLSWERGAGRLLRLWAAHGTWNTKVFKERLKITKQGLYELRNRLMQRGFVDPQDKKKLRLPSEEVKSEQGEQQDLRDV